MNPSPSPSSLTSRDIAALIPYAKEGEYLGNDIIEINVGKRGLSVSLDEHTLLTSIGYVPLFDHLVIGWAMYIRQSHAESSQFFQNERLPIKESRFQSTFSS